MYWNLLWAWHCAKHILCSISCNPQVGYFNPSPLTGEETEVLTGELISGRTRTWIQTSPLQGMCSPPTHPALGFPTRCRWRAGRCWPAPPWACKQCHLVLCTGCPLHSGSAPLRNQQGAALPGSGDYFQKWEMSVKQDTFSKIISAYTMKWYQNHWLWADMWLVFANMNLVLLWQPFGSLTGSWMSEARASGGWAHAPPGVSTPSILEHRGVSPRFKWTGLKSNLAWGSNPISKLLILSVNLP